MDNDKLLQLCDVLGVLRQLENRGYVERGDGEVIFTKRAEEALAEVNAKKLTPKLKEVVEWIDEYRSLFPSGVRSGGYLVKGSKQACIKKMRQFLKEYPEYDKDLILEATHRYVERKARENYKYMQLAHYFILKDGASNLAAECEQIADGFVEPENPFEQTM